jgi:hypothetical protein
MAVVIKTLSQVTVATSGTEQRLSATDVEYVVKVILSVPAANTGTMYVGDSGVNVNNGIAIIKGTSLEIAAPQGDFLDVKNMYVDAATDGDKINVTVLKKVVG